MAPVHQGFVVAVVAELASAAQSVAVAFDTAGSAVNVVLDSCTMSRKYVINSPSSCNCSTARQILISIDIVSVDRISGAAPRL